MTAAGTYGFMTINEDSLAANFNGAQHGVEFKDGNTFTFPVSGNTIFKFGGCQYSAGSFTATASDANGSLLKTQLRVRLQLVIIRTAQQLTLHMLVVLVQ